jgi:hypothetical protein
MDRRNQTIKTRTNTNNLCFLTKTFFLSQNFTTVTPFNMVQKEPPYTQNTEKQNCADKKLNMHKYDITQITG